MADHQPANTTSRKALSALLPEKYQTLAYFAKDGLVKVLNDLKSGELLENLPEGPGGQFGDMQDAFDSSKLPDAEVLTKNLEGVIGYTESVDEGVKWVWIAKLKGN